MLQLALLFCTQLPPAAPMPTYPPPGGVRNIYEPLRVSAAPPEVTRSAFELRVEDGGSYDCSSAASCPAVKTAPPFETQLTSAITDGRWCFRARYENDAGTSPWSTERCFLEDRTGPPAPFDVDGGTSQGMVLIHYHGTPEPGPQASGIERFCGGAVELNTGDEYFPYCNGGYLWHAPGTTLDGTLLLPVPPGAWRAAVVAVDVADNGSARVAGGPALVLPSSGPAPPPPFWRLPDGGVGPDAGAASDAGAVEQRRLGVGCSSASGVSWLAMLVAAARRRRVSMRSRGVRDARPL